MVNWCPVNDVSYLNHTVRPGHDGDRLHPAAEQVGSSCTSPSGGDSWSGAGYPGALPTGGQTVRPPLLVRPPSTSTTCSPASSPYVAWTPPEGGGANGIVVVSDARPVQRLRQTGQQRARQVGRARQHCSRRRTAAPPHVFEMHPDHLVILGRGSYSDIDPLGINRPGVRQCCQCDRDVVTTHPVTLITSRHEGRRVIDVLVMSMLLS